MQLARKEHGPDEFGDFQTPLSLTANICQFLANRGIEPAVFVEPTCGLGNFVLSALDYFPTASGLGVEINPAYVAKLRTSLGARRANEDVRLIEQSFFEIDWQTTFRNLPEPILVLGNPPWVTNAQLGILGSANLPEKTNFQGHKGLDALLGKSNFDISEWMLIQLLEALKGRQAWLAMLCKTAVARKTLLHAWKYGIAIEWAEIRNINAGTTFGAAVDASLLVCSLSSAGDSNSCGVFSDFETLRPTSLIGYRDGHLVADMRAYEIWKHLVGQSPYKWRSGVKHNCSKVMELCKEINGFRNGLGELVALEPDYVFPMLKSSELANGRVSDPMRWMVVPQRAVGENTDEIRLRSPKTWQYLVDHGETLDNRRSSIYQKRPRFSVFGIGEYTFAPWKVAISGFYKRLKFTVVGSYEGKPTVFDDTVNFIACQSEKEACYLASLLNSEAAQQFFSAFVFWDAKRPITVDLLSRLDLQALAQHLSTDGFLL